MSTATALLHLAFLAAMLLILVGGMALILVLWYVRGRDPHAGPVAKYFDHPPDDLPPGAAGTLLDEHVDDHDVTATLLGLARDGAVEITELPESDGRRDFVLTLRHPDRIESRLERDLLTVLFGPDATPGAETRLGQVRGRFEAHRERIRDDLYREMVVRGYFQRSPEETRQRWRRISIAGIVGSLIGGALLVAVTDWWALEPIVASVIVWLVMLRMSRSMPQKTRHGAEAAAKWRAFRAWLHDIRAFEQLDANPGLFDRYFAYAVAFNLEKEWVRAFERAGAPAPRWYRRAGEIGDVVIIPDLGGVPGDLGGLGEVGRHLGRVGEGGLPNVDLGGMPNVDIGGVGDGLQGASELMGAGLQGASDGLADLLDSAGSIFDIFDW
jgi:hypothetical protein